MKIKEQAVPWLYENRYYGIRMSTYVCRSKRFGKPDGTFPTRGDGYIHGRFKLKVKSIYNRQNVTS